MSYESEEDQRSHEVAKKIDRLRKRIEDLKRSAPSPTWPVMLGILDLLADEL